MILYVHIVPLGARSVHETESAIEDRRAANGAPDRRTLRPRPDNFFESDVAAITGLEANSARSLIRKAEARGLVTRLKPGLFVLVPPELGSATEFSGNPYLTARAMVGGAEYYISHSSAMELHRMVTQPQFTIDFATLNWPLSML